MDRFDTPELAALKVKTRRLALMMSGRTWIWARDMATTNGEASAREEVLGGC
jgi:hypothetical protein